jgi:hypothetical protein
MTRIPVSALSVGAAVAFFALVGHAQIPTGPLPSISSVTGVTTQGSILTIAGANLHAETMQSWDNRFLRIPDSWSFEGASPAADGYTLIGTNQSYDSTVSLIGNKSFKFRSAINNPTCTTGVGESYAYAMVEDPASANEAWVWVYARYNRVSPDWPDNYIKMLSFLSSGYLFQPDSRNLSSGTNPYRWVNFHDGANHEVSSPLGALENNRWYAIELHWSVSPRKYEAWVDGVKIYTGTPTSGQTWQIFFFGILNACGSKSWNIEHWEDGLAIGHQRIYPSAFVEVGDGPNYSTANKRSQALESIADNQINFRLNTSGLGSGPLYVWVRNNAQQLSPAYFLTGGQVSGPSAPSNLRILP